MSYNTNKNNLIQNKVVSFLSANWFLLLAVVMGLPPLLRYFKEQSNKNTVQDLKIEKDLNTEQNAKASPDIIRKKVAFFKKKYPNLSTKDIERLKTVAQKVAFSLGTNVQDQDTILGLEYNNISAWGEDEEVVVKYMKTVPNTFPVVEDFYYSLYTRSRNLKNDLYKYLSKNDLSLLRTTYKKYGKTWL